MQFISSILFALTANLDSIAVAVSYGTKKIRIGLWSNLLIGAFSAAGTLLAMAIGVLIKGIVSVSVANMAGSAVLILLGIWFTADSVLKMRSKPQHKADRELEEPPPAGAAAAKKESVPKELLEACHNSMELLEAPERADKDQSGSIDLRESIALAFALAVNNFAAGIGASMSGLNLAVTTLSTFVLNIVFILLGCRIGSGSLSRFFGRYTSLVSGLFIILLGVYEFFL